MSSSKLVVDPVSTRVTSQWSSRYCSAEEEHSDSGFVELDPRQELVSNVASVSFEEHYLAHSSRILGRGAQSGSVVEAECLRTGKSVAVKTYRREELDVESLQSVEAEIDILSHLDHPGVVKLEGFYQSEAEIQVVMERLSGGELLERISQAGTLHEALAAQLTAQVLQAVERLHERGVCHRDLKPENLMFAEAGGSELKIIDFGFAVRFLPEEAPALTQRCGTLGYAAPEVVSGQPYGEKADLWSVGVIVFAMLLGRLPFRGGKDVVLQKSRSGKVDYGHRFTALSKDAQNFVKRLMTVDPNQRLSAYEALQHPWLLQVRERTAESA